VADWQRVDQVAKNDAGQYMALVGGQWQPAEGGAKNDAGQYMALLSGGGIDQSVQDPRDAQAQGKAGIQLPPEQQGPTEQPQGAVGLQNTQPGYFMGEGSKALARGLLDVKQMPQAIKVFASSENVKIARDKLAAWNQIDDGTTPPPAQPQPGDPEIQGTEGRTQSWEYAQATPQQRIDMRAKVLKSISDNQDDQRAAIKVWQEFAAQKQKLTGRVPSLTDVHDATDFRDYLTSSLGEGALPLAAMVTASAIPRVGFGLVSAIMAGTSVAGGTGAALESAQTPAMGGQHVEGRWVPGQAATIQPNDAQAVMDQRRAGIGLAAGAETAMGALSPTQAVGRDALGAAVQGIKSTVGRVAAKAGLGAADMGVQNVAQYGMDTAAQGETPTLGGAADALTTGIITGAAIAGAHGAMHARKENAARVAADQDAQIRAAAQTVADQGAAPADQMRAAAGMQPGEMPGGPGEPPAPAAPGAPEVVGSGGAPTDKTAESPSGSSGSTPPAHVDPAVAQLEQARDLAKNSPSETVRAAAQKIIDADEQRKAASTEAERLAGEVGHTIDALRDARDAGNEPLATELETALAKLQKQAAKAREAAGEAPPKGGIEVKEGTVEHIEVPPVDEEKVGNERAAAAAAEDKDERETYYGTDQPKDALTGSDADRAASRGRSPLLKGLRDAGGIRTDQLSEIGLDRKRADGKRQSWSIGQGQPLFHKQGALADDSLAEHLHQHGYLADESDVDGAHEMVRQEWENPGSVKPLRERDRQAEDALAARYDRERDQELAEEARAIGIDPTGRTSEDLQNAVIAAHHADWTHLAQHGLTPDHAADWAEVHRAAHRDLAATEEAGRQYPAHGDDFMRAIREINGGLDSERESNQGGDQHQSGPGGEAGKPAVRGESAEAAGADRGTGQEPADRAGNGQQGRDAGEPGGNAQAGPEVPDGGAERRTATAAQGRGPLDEAGIRRFARAAQAAAQKAGFDLKELFRKGYVRIVDSSNASHPLASHPGVSALYVPPIRGADGKMERRGYVEIYADRADPQRIPELILHEVGDHLGLLGLGRDGYDKLLNEILDNRNAPDVQRTWREVAQNYPDLPEGGRAFLREVSAHLAETGADRGTTRKLLDHAQAMAYKTLGIRLGRTGDLVRGLAAAMARSIQNSRFDIAKERMAIPEREGESIRIAREASAAGRAAWAAANGGAAAKQTEAKLRGPLSADQARAHPSIGPVMAAADSLGLSALHEATDFNVQEAHHGDDAATVHIGTDGRVKITLWGAHNELVDSGDPRDLSQAQRLVYHELMHVMDAANRGGIYSAHPDLWIDHNRAGDIVGIGDAARELIQLYRNNDLLNKMLHYPLHTDYSGMGPTELPKELFAQAQTAYLAKTAREIIEREAPNAARYLRIALEQARGAKAPLTESDRQIARTAFAAATRRGTDERSATAADSGRPGGGGDAGGRPGFDGIAASQRTERERDPILDVRPAPIWKSALHDAVASMPDKKMPGSSWLAEIKGLVNKGKVKAEELRWVGLDDALKAAPGKLSRDDVAKWIADNGVRLDEVRYGDTRREQRDALKAARNRVLDVLKEARGFMESGGVDPDEMASAIDALQNHKPQSGVDDPQLTKAYELLREHAPPGYDFNTINDAHDAHARAIEDWDAARIADSSQSATRHAKYTLPGGENYRETVLTLPSRNGEAIARLTQQRRAESEKIREALIAVRRSNITPNEYAEIKLAATGRIDEIDRNLIELAKESVRRAEPHFEHNGHWPGVENPVAHLRTTDRVDAEGKRNLHVEEFQSDWGEQGRSKGFSDKSKVADAERRLEAFDAETESLRGAILDQMKELAKNGQRDILTMSEEDSQRWHDLDRQQAHITDERWAQRAPLNDELSRARSGLPLAPFVGNTQHWVALLIKRAIRMAAEGGYDRVTWSRGDQINNVLSISRVVRKISWDAEPKRNLRRVVMDLTQYRDPMELVVDNRNGEIAQVSDDSQSAWVGKNLSEVVGKEMADKIMSDKVEYGSLEGDGLKVGGEGNRKFYDQVVPNVANDVLKKFGGGRVRDVDYGNGPASVERYRVFFDDDAVNNGERGGWYIEDENGPRESRFVTREEAQAQANEYNADEDQSTAIGRQQGFDITPEMRAQASEAMPMFSKREAPRARDPILDTRPGTDERDQNFRRWSNDAPMVRSADADNYPFKSGQKFVAEAFHGTKRPDRVGSRFRKSRATSGPMSFFTSDPQLASGYAASKNDTSLQREDQGYETWFRYKPKGARTAVNIDRAWYHLDRETQDKIARIAPTLHEDDDGNLVSTPGKTSGNGGYDQALAETQRGWDKRGNPLKALVEAWLNSGSMFDREEDFGKLLEAAGMPKGSVEMHDPHAQYPAVYKTFVHMDRPLVTTDIPPEVRDALNTAAKRDRSSPVQGATGWDKDSQTLRDWVRDFNSGDDAARYLWTLIPEKVTKVLRSLGYDGIVDRSGKGGGPEHPVYIPFDENQVKSALGNKGTFDRDSSDIAASQRTPKDDIGLTYPGAKMPGGGGTPPRRPGAPGPAATPPGGTPPLAQRNPFYRRIWDSPFLQKARDLAGNIFRDIQSKTSPMTATSTKEFQAMAKDYANAMRQGRQKFAEWFDILNRNYNADQLRRMWEAGDEENDMRREQRLNGTPLDPSKGLASLPKDQRDVMDFMSAYGTKLLAEAKALGMYEGEGVDYWVPRTAARIGADGDYEPLLPGARGEGGGSPRTKSKNLTGRNWDTTAEAEAALQGREGTGAKFIRDIRTMPLAMRRLEEAIAGRRLVDRVLEESQKMALDPAAFVPASDHPAFKVYQADINDPTAPWKVTTMRIPKEAKGPLDAVLSKAPGDAYKGLLALKNWGVGNIMFSPFIHLGVELGRAAPVMRGKMLTLGFWKDGAAMLRNPDLLRQAIGEGYVKIGRQNLSEDMSSMEREPELHPGRGLTAQVAGLAARPFGKNARQAAMRGVDRIGDFVHGTLLWDRIAQLQAGIYLTTRKAAIAKGMQPRVAGIVAAHIANRYAGALPPESISSAGRKVANLLLFSRSFTLGNLGVMKDALTGLPQDVRAQIETEFGQAQLVKATSYSRRKAFAGVIADVGMMAALNAVAQSGISALNKQQQDPEWDKQLLSKLKFLGAEGVGGVVGMGALGVPGMVAGALGAGWLADQKAAVAQSHDLVDSMVRGMKSAAMDPVHAVLHPFDTLESMSPTYRNEPGKGDRILVGHEPDGTAIYVRLPFGKVAEEIKGWATRPAWRGPDGTPSMLEQKSSTLVHPLQYAYTNDTGFGRKLYKDNDDVLVKGGKIAGELMKEQVPADSIASAYRMLQGKGQPMDPEKFLGPLLGLTFSKGAPGGEASGELFREESRHKADVADAAPDIKQAIKDGDQATAKRLMDAAGMTAEERRSMIKHTLHPETYVSARALRQFQQTATPEEKARMASARAARQPAQPEQ
jgi:hypothetical protein